MLPAASQLMFAGVVPAFLLGAAVAYWRIWHLFQVALKFKNYDPSRKYREYHKCVAQQLFRAFIATCKHWQLAKVMPAQMPVCIFIVASTSRWASTCSVARCVVKVQVLVISGMTAGAG